MQKRYSLAKKQKQSNSLTDNFGYPDGKVWDNTNGNSISPFDFKEFYSDEKNKDKVKLISFKTNEEKEKREKLLKETVLKITKINENEYHALTGNYVGFINIEPRTSVQIKSRFDDTFLSHMLKYINDIFVIDAGDSFKRDDENQSDNVIRFILCHLFIRSLDKASAILGLPKAYQQHLHVGYNVRGKIDMRHLVHHNIPLRGTLHFHYAQRTEVQEIMDVLYVAANKVLQFYPKMLIGNTLSLYHSLKEKRSAQFVSKATISKAKEHKALTNPLYQPYKKVLKYANWIIDYLDDLEYGKNAELQSYSYLIDVSELFEIYIEKVLQRGLAEKGWIVKSQVETEIYKDTFFSRKLKPDIVLEKDNKVAVFDVKYKRMNYEGINQHGMGDLDRNDFFQIHTYMAYYQGMEGKELIGGGLFYPIEGNLKENNEKAHSKRWLNNKGFFVVSGIELEKEMTIEKILTAEEGFINCINKILDESDIAYQPQSI